MLGKNERDVVEEGEETLLLTEADLLFRVAVLRWLWRHGFRIPSYHGCIKARKG